MLSPRRVGAARGFLVGWWVIWRVLFIGWEGLAVTKNKGEFEKHYITAGHDPIILPELFDYVQEILAERQHDKFVYLKKNSIPKLNNKEMPIQILQIPFFSRFRSITKETI